MKDVDVKHYKPISLIDHSRVRLIFSMNTELYTQFPLLQKSLLDNLKNISITDTFPQSVPEFFQRNLLILTKNIFSGASSITLRFQTILDPHNKHFFLKFSFKHFLILTENAFFWGIFYNLLGPHR